MEAAHLLQKIKLTAWASEKKNPPRRYRAFTKKLKKSCNRGNTGFYKNIFIVQN